jgi:hypothetical protein
VSCCADVPAAGGDGDADAAAFRWWRGGGGLEVGHVVYARETVGGAWPAQSGLAELESWRGRRAAEVAVASGLLPELARLVVRHLK